jgi:hypothetical protein
MPEEAPIDLPLEEPAAARHYALLCLLMLLVLTVQFVERMPDVWSVLPLLFGAAFLFVRWRDGPLVVLFLVAWLLASEGYYGVVRDVLHDLLNEDFSHFARQSRVEALFDDFLVAGAFLVYAVSYYRYLGFTRHLFPPDPRERTYAEAGFAERRRRLEEPQRRGPDTVTAREFLLLALALPLCLGGAWLLWNWLADVETRSYVFETVLASALKLLYLFGIPLLLFRAAVAYANQCRAHRGENAQFLQDQLWRETRREQGRVNRWLTWARLRAQRREERT